MKRLLYILAISVLSSAVFGQGSDPHLSMQNYQSLNLNPALTGNMETKFRWQNSYREQYAVISRPYRTYSSALDFNLPINAWGGNIWGFGLNAIQDDQGDANLVNTRINVSLAVGQYLDPREEHSLSVGFQGGLGQRAIKYDNVYWNSQWVGSGFALYKNPNEPLIEATKQYLDMSTGIQYQFNGSVNADFGTGISMYHFNRPDNSLYLDTNNVQLDRRINWHTNAEFRIRDGSMFATRPSFVFTKQGKVNLFMVGNEFVFFFSEPTRTTGEKKEYSMSLGLHHRWLTDMIGSIMFNLGGLQIGASYDVTLGNINKLNGYQGAYEVFIGYRGGYRKGSRNRYSPFRKGKH
ncbi:MAG: hypothetical protein GWP27_06905 [Bacteroidetes bacterium]|nr:hypothetical protein [Bacteroidota bacterium]